MDTHKNDTYGKENPAKSVQAAGTEEGMYRKDMDRFRALMRAARQKLRRRKTDAAASREKRYTTWVLCQELKAMTAAAVVYWGCTAGLIDKAFAVPVLIAAQTVVCFRAGYWCGRRQSKAK